MKKMICVVALWACAGWVPAMAKAPDSVAIDPVVHKVLFENEFVRVFDARASRGAKSPMHSHPPMVLVSLSSARFRMTLPDGTRPILDLSPGQTIWRGETTEHAWELLAGELRVIAVEIKSAQSAEAPPAVELPPDDAVAVDPDVHRVLFENPHVRVFEGRVSHPRSSPMHSHPPAVFVSLDWVRMKQTTPDGQQSLLELSPAQALWLAEGARHSWETVAGAARVIAIEVKAARAAPKQ